MTVATVSLRCAFEFANGVFLLNRKRSSDTRIPVVRHKAAWSIWTVLLTAVSWGIVAFTVDVVLYVLALLGDEWAVHYLIAASFLVGFMFRFRNRIGDRLRYAAAGIAFGTGFNILVVAECVHFLLTGTGTRGSLDASLAAKYALCSIGASAGVALAMSLVFAVRRATTAKLDGTSCPQCSYSLIGNTSMQCPECGRGFTFAELGTTEEEFRRRSVQASTTNPQ